MSASRRHKRGGSHHEEEHENEERWLVSFADMMTLLFCLFMVLFAISSVNTSKLEALAASLQESFSGKVVSGGAKVMETGASSSETERAQVTPPLPAITPVAALAEQTATTDAHEIERRANQEEEELKRLKARVKALAMREGVSSKVKVTVRRR